MNMGLIYSLLAAVSFAGSAVSVRKIAARTGEAFTPTIMSVLIGLPFFAVAVTFTGEWGKLPGISWPALVLLGVAGIMHFIFGRLLSYNAYRILGANRGTTLSVTSPFSSVLFGVLFLHESISVYLVLGVIFIVGGAFLVTTSGKSTAVTDEASGSRTKGIIYALAGAMCWGSSPILIKPALAQMGGSPMVGAFVSYAVAFVVVLFILGRRNYRERMLHLPFVRVFLPLVLSALFASAGQFFIYTALTTTPASVVTPLVGTHVLLVFLLSAVISRNLETFNFRVVLAMIATVAGGFLMFQ